MYRTMLIWVIVGMLGLLTIQFTFAAESTTTRFSLNTFHAHSGVVEHNFTDYNISAGTGQVTVGNQSTTSFNPQVGIYYLDNVSGLDSTSPEITVYSPTATTYAANNITINFTATDPSGISDTWYYNTSENVSYTIGTPQYIWLPDDTYTVDFYANDTLNNLANVSVQFTVLTQKALNLSIEDYGIEWVSLNWT